MLTTPGSALLIKADTSVLSGDDGATDALLNPPPDVDDVDDAGAEATVVLEFLPATAPPTVPPAIVNAAIAASAKRRRPDRTGTASRVGGLMSETGGEPAGAGHDDCSSPTLGSWWLNMSDLPSSGGTCSSCRRSVDEVLKQAEAFFRSFSASW